MDLQPFAEHVAQFVRQPKHDIASLTRSGRIGAGQDCLQFLIVDRGNDRRGHHARRHAGVVERLDRLEPLLRRRRTGLHLAGEPTIERGHGYKDLDQIVARHRRQEVEIPQNEVRFGDDGERVTGFSQRLDQRPGNAILPLDRLIGVGVGAEGDRRGPVLGRGKLALQKRRGALLGKKLGFEIEPGREPHIGVGRPGVAIKAAVLAAAIGIDRAVESNVRRLVARDDRLGLFPCDLGRQRFWRFVARPAVVELLALLELETAGCIGRGAATAPQIGGQDALGDRLRAMARVDGEGSAQARVHRHVP